MNKKNKKKIIITTLGLIVPTAIATSVALATVSHTSNNSGNVANKDTSSDSSNSDSVDNITNGTDDNTSNDDNTSDDTTTTTPDVDSDENPILPNPDGSNSDSVDGSGNSGNTDSTTSDDSNDNSSSSDTTTTPSDSDNSNVSTDNATLDTSNIDYSSDTSDISNVADLDFFYYDKILESKPRTVNKEVYETELVKQYGAYGFKYPGYNVNYESGNRYITVNGQKVNMMNLVYNERTTNAAGKSVKYNDTSWIKEQIAAGTLKQHPAAATWYRQTITDSTPTVTKEFKIGTTKMGVIPLGLYAAPGEVITLKFDTETFNKIKNAGWRGFSVVLNNNYWDNYKEGNTGQISNRYPFLKTSFSINPTQQTITFGSPFGGNISINLSTSLLTSEDGNAFNTSSQVIDFTVEGAIESMHYVHGFTTEEDWDRQITALKAGTITAPNFAGMYSWASMNIPFTGVNNISGVNMTTVAYPYETFKKWNTWQFLSTYIARNDVNNAYKLLDIEFCDDIWNGGGAWGGGGGAWVPVSWGANGFLTGTQGFSILKSWGLMHEINHTYEQDSGLFKRRGHGGTNQVTTVSLAMVSDTGRYRSPNNTANEYDNNGNAWSYVSNSYSNIRKILADWWSDEYRVNAAIVFAIGGENYLNYVRNDTVNHPNTMSGWTGLKEIQHFSQYFKLNYWPAFEGVGRFWRDTWPTSYAAASEAEKEIIDSLDQYPAIDFVGNLYAAGNYMYDGETGEYTYTGDTQPVYEIPAGDDYTFDFGKWTNSLSKNFTWTTLKASATSKNGVELVKDGNKKLVYKGSTAYSTDIDEFDVDLIPGDWDGKPTNYVPSYRFKIKVRPVVNRPTNYLYNGVTSAANDFLAINMIDEMKKYDPSLKIVAYNNNAAMYTVGGTNQVARQKFTFVAPKAGTYKFNATWSNAISAYVNGESVYKNAHKSKASTTFYEVDLSSGETLDFDIYTYVESGRCALAVSASVDGASVNVFFNSLAGAIDNINKLTNNKYTASQYLTDDRFQYKLRTIDLTHFKQANSSYNLLTNYSAYKPGTVYSLSVSNVKIPINNLNNTTSYLEIWENSTTKRPQFTYKVNFTSPTDVASIRFGHRTNNHTPARPTYIKVVGTTEDGSSITLYDGKYGAQFNDRLSAYSITNFDGVYKLKSMAVTLKNENYYGLVLNSFQISNQKAAPLSNNISILDNYIAKTPNWSVLNNESNIYNNISGYDGRSLLSTKSGDMLDIKIKRTVGVNVVGTIVGGQTTTVDIYIDGKLYQENVSLSADSTQMNVSLFKYINSSLTSGEVRLTIVHKDNNPLIINYFQTYGSQVAGTMPIKA